MRTIDDLRSEAAGFGPPAPLDTTYEHAEGIWPDEYRDYERLSRRLAQNFPHEFDLRYGPDPRHIIDVWMPTDPVEDAPVHVFFHGGSMEDGHPRQYGYLARPFLEAGAIFVCPSYRLMDPVLAAERRELQRRSDVFVHELGADADPVYTRTRDAGARAAQVAAVDARAAIAWVHRNISVFGGRPDRLVVSGHSAGAMLAVTTACSDDWQAEAEVPLDVVSGMMPISGRYGLWQGSAIISQRDVSNPPHDWMPLPRIPEAAVVFNEIEWDGEGRDVEERSRDCARIGRTLLDALRAGGGSPIEVRLPEGTHSDSVRSLGTPGSPTVDAAFTLMGINR